MAQNYLLILTFMIVASMTPRVIHLAQSRNPRGWPRLNLKSLNHYSDPSDDPQPASSRTKKHSSLGENQSPERRHRSYPSLYDLYSVESDIKPQINKFSSSLKELEHQARQNICTLNFATTFAKTSSSCNSSGKVSA